MSLVLYNLLFPIAFVLYLPGFVAKLIRRGGYSGRFMERFGIYSKSQKAQLRGLPQPIWVHAVSVGEVVAAAGFIRRWRERRPDLTFVLSTTTTTGHATAAKKLPEDVSLIYTPLDCYFVVRRALRLIQPRMLVIFEVEFWPNLISQAARAGVPVALANGRMSDRSARGYVRHRWFFGQLFSRLSVFCVQSAEDAERLRCIVGDRVPVHTCNTMKFDQIADVAGSDKSEVLDRVFGSRDALTWVAGSTHSGEEELVSAAFVRLKADFPELKLILVPRHHERTAEVEGVLREAGLSYRLLRPRGGEPGLDEPVDVLLVNTTGELMNFYAAADVVFVGKSLAGNEGGHNIIEPAIFGKPIVHGANMQNFRAVAQIFRDSDATIAAATDDALESAVRGLLADAEGRERLGCRARDVVERFRGAIDRTLDCLDPLLGVQTSAGDSTSAHSAAT